MAKKTRVRVKVRDHDRGWRKLRRQIFGTDKHVTVGIHGEEDGRNAGIGNVGLAAVHEFGTKEAGPNRDIVIPERSFIRSTIDNNTRKYHAISKKLGKRVYQTKITTAQALAILGLKVAADMRRTIQQTPSDWPALKDATIAARRHGGTKPLLDTSELQKSIKHKVFA